MTRAAELIAYLLARSPGRLLIDRRSGLPYGWSLWMRSLVERAAAFGGADLVAHVLTLPRPAPAGVAPRLSYWQAFRRLWWQQWEPRPRDERPLHWLAVLGSLFVHVGFVLLLLWVALVSWAPQEDEADGERVALEFIGSGTPQVGDGAGRGEPGGESAPAAEQPASAQTSRRPAPETASRPASPVEPEPPPAPALQVAQAPETTATPEPVATPEPAAAPEREAVQAASATARPPTLEIERPVVQVDPRPVQATEVEQATVEFVVPPLPAVTTATIEPRSQPTQTQVRERAIEPLSARPQITAPRSSTPVTVELPAGTAPAVREREVVVVDRPQVSVARTPELRVPQRELALPAPEVRVRDIPLKPAPAPVPELASAPAPAPAQERREAPAPAEAPRPVPATTAPASTPTATAAASPPAAPSSSASSERSAATPTTTPGRAGPSPASPTASASPAASAPRANPAAGDDWSRQRGDDWGLGARAQAGSAADGQGLLGRDGRIDVPGAGQADPPRGAPGSASDTWSRDRIAQSGTWLKRPPYDYTPTSFDQYWTPNESLLAEWVRSGIKQIDIAIPGTTSRITCVVSLLQFGGGCGLSDPNMNEQPATARPPPDIPFKKELQDANGSVR